MPMFQGRYCDVCIGLMWVRPEHEYEDLVMLICRVVGEAIFKSVRNGASFH